MKAKPHHVTHAVIAACRGLRRSLARPAEPRDKLRGSGLKEATNLNRMSPAGTVHTLLPARESRRVPGTPAYQCVACLPVCHQISSPSVISTELLWRHWQSLDADNSGGLSSQEFCAAIKKLVSPCPTHPLHLSESDNPELELDSTVTVTAHLASRASHWQLQ